MLTVFIQNVIYLELEIHFVLFKKGSEMSNGQNCGNYDENKEVGLQQLDSNELKQVVKDPGYLAIQTASIYVYYSTLQIYIFPIKMFAFPSKALVPILQKRAMSLRFTPVVHCTSPGSTTHKHHNFTWSSSPFQISLR